MNGRFQMQGGKNRILPKYINANRFFWDSHWLEIWSNHFCPSMGLNGVSVATDSGGYIGNLRGQLMKSAAFLLVENSPITGSYNGRGTAV
jgi:hypothetical protein